MEGTQAKRHAGFRWHHSTTDHLITLKIIAKKCGNNKTNLFCSFVDVRKYFDMVPRTNLWNILEGLKVPFDLKVSPVEQARGA